MENLNMVAPSTLSPAKGKRSTKKTEEPTTPAEAGELLLSALDYCKKAGLKVTGYNDDGALVLRVDGLEYSGLRILPAVTPIVTPSVPVVTP